MGALVAGVGTTLLIRIRLHVADFFVIFNRTLSQGYVS